MKRLILSLLVLGSILAAPPSQAEAELETLSWTVHDISSNATNLNRQAVDAGSTSVNVIYPCSAGTCQARLSGTDPTNWNINYSLNWTTGVAYVNASTWINFNFGLGANQMYLWGRFSHDDGLTWGPPIVVKGASGSSAPNMGPDLFFDTPVHFFFSPRDGSISYFYDTANIYTTKATIVGSCQTGAGAQGGFNYESGGKVGENILGGSPFRVLYHTFTPNCGSLISTQTLITGCESQVGPPLVPTRRDYEMSAFVAICGGTGTDINGDLVKNKYLYHWDTTTYVLERLNNDDTLSDSIWCRTTGRIEYCASGTKVNEYYVFWRWDGGDWSYSPIPVTSATALNGLAFFNNRFHVIDHAGSSIADYYSGEITPPGLPGPEPSEFDTGFVGFVESLGFKTIQSKMLVTIILVGLMTVMMGLSMRIMPASKMKNIVIGGTAVLVAIFCSILGFLPLWMMTLSLVLAGFTYQGFTDFKNTWSEVKGAFARRPMPMPTAATEPEAAFTPAPTEPMTPATEPVAPEPEAAPEPALEPAPADEGGPSE